MRYDLMVRDPQTLRTVVERWAVTLPDNPAVLAPGRPPTTFADLLTRLDGIHAALLARGFTSSSRVAVALQAGHDMATAVLAVASTAACVPLNPAARHAELREHLIATRAEVVLCGQGESGPITVARELGLPVIDAESIGDEVGQGTASAARSDKAAGRISSTPDAVALLLLTSGTTAKPKVVPLTQRKLVASAQNVARHLALTPEDRSLVVMPLFHSHGIVGALLSSIAAGARAVCVPGWDEAQFFDWVEQFQPTWYTATPPIHQRVVELGGEYRRRAPQHRFRFVRSTSAPLPVETLVRLEALFAAPVIESFGMTEWSQMASNPLPPFVRKQTSVGLPTGVDVAILVADGTLALPGQSGQIAVRGANLTTRYEGSAQSPGDESTDQWFLTGDLGRLDDDGYLYLEGRLSDAINKGGEKVSPFEVEETLLRHPAVADAVVFPVPHPSLGEDLAAAVVLRKATDVDEAALRGFVSSTLSDVKTPSSILLVSEVPRSQLGKLQRRQLHHLFERLLAGPPVESSTELEQTLATIVGAVLNRSGIGVHENFFGIGGDSLSGIRVVTRINRHFGIKLPATVLFRCPTIAALSNEITPSLRAVASIEDEVAALSDAEVAALLAAEDSSTKGAGEA